MAFHLGNQVEGLKMNITPMEKQIQALNVLVEGNSIRSTERITGMHRDTIMRLLVRVGQQCQRTMDGLLRGFHCEHMEVDEIWSFVKKKEKRLKPDERALGIYGDQYVYVALDADTKLVPAFMVGRRTAETTLSFLNYLQDKLKGNGRIQLTTDGFKAYETAVEETFGSDIDYAMLIKVYGSVPESEKRYSPPQVKEVVSKVINGNPDPDRICTSLVERQNLTMRMAMRRFTRLTNAFSKKLENLKAAVALHFAHYNFMRVHSTLKVTPAMEAGITDHIWDWRELVFT